MMNERARGPINIETLRTSHGLLGAGPRCYYYGGEPLHRPELLQRLRNLADWRSEGGRQRVSVAGFAVF